LAGKDARDVVVGDETQTGETTPQLAAIRPLEVECFLELILGDQALFDQYFAKPDGHPRTPAI